MTSKQPLPRFAALVLGVALVSACWHVIAAPPIPPPAYALLAGSRMADVNSVCYLRESVW